MKNRCHPSFLLLLSLCWLHLLTGGAFAANRPLELKETNPASISLTTYFDVLEDPSQKLTLAEVQNPAIAAQFKGDQASRSDLNFGFSRSAYWLRLRLQNASENRLERMLEVSFPPLSSVQLYSPPDLQRPGGEYRVHITGASLPFASRAFENRQFVFPLKLAARTDQVYYLRIQSSGSMVIPVQLWKPLEFNQYVRNDYLVQTWYFGMLSAMILFNFFLFLALRDFIYLLYINFAIATSLAVATQTGLAHEFLWPGASMWSNISTFTAYSLSLSTMLFFVRSVLNTNRLIPRIDKLIKILAWFLLITPIGFAISLHSLAKYAAIMDIFTIILAGAIGVYAAIKRQRSAYFFVLAFTMLTLGALATGLKGFGVFPTNIFTVNGISLGGALEMVLLALALADRFNIIRKEKSAAEINTLLAQNQLAQAEKMAALGQLIASVGHEINTPIGAVKSSGQIISDALGEALMNMPRLFQTLDADSVTRFLALIQGANSPVAILSSREERAITQQVSAQLEAAGITHAHQKAGALVQLNAQGALDDYLPLLQHNESTLILATASSMATIINNTKNINAAVDRVTKMLLALKSFSRVDQHAEPIQAHLHDGLETVLTIYQGQFRLGTELVRQYEEIPAISCLPDELNQVWTNLIHNALQAMNHEGTLTLGIRRVGDEAVVSIGDTGAGIPEAIRDKVFNVFFTTKPVGEGSGLGLDIVKKIIEKHHGRIDFKSEIGVGTTFFVYLPYATK